MAIRVDIKKNVNDKTVAYILYMIISSYFKKSYCKTPFIEETLFLYYSEMSLEKQIKQEVQIINGVEKRIKTLLGMIAAEVCSVEISCTENGYKIYFDSKYIKMKVYVNKKGKYKIFYKKIIEEVRKIAA